VHIALHSEGARLESHLGYRLSSFRIFVVFLSLSKKMPVYNFNIGKDRLLLNPYLLIFHEYLSSHSMLCDL
jgi:hypothetical protein